MAIKYTTSIFLDKCKEIHGEKYLYDKVKYTNAHSKVIITCRKHGDFEQSAYSHLQGIDCKKCKYEEKCITDFVNKAKQVHGDVYDYNKSVYIKSSIPIKIICKKHGAFYQNPYYHLKGGGCQKCGWKNIMHDTKSFIKKAKEIHGDQYDYTNTKYEHSLKPVSIMCKKHGVFIQKASSHLAGSGCRSCSTTGFFDPASELSKEQGIFYIIYIEEEDFIKVGITRRTVSKRYVGALMPYKYKILYEKKDSCKVIWEIEKKIKNIFKRYSYTPLKDFQGKTECYKYKVIHKLLILLK